MRDISHKVKSLRTATAQAVLKVSPKTIALIQENKIPKGNPLEVSKVAAVQAAKNTQQILPYCHPIPIDYVGADFILGEDTIVVTTTVKAIYKTGVEMEALTAASVAALNLYDMMKQLDKTMTIASVQLLSKTGGTSDFATTLSNPLRAAVLVLSDSVSQGHKNDLSGKLIVERLHAHGVEVADFKAIADNLDVIEKTLKNYSDEVKLDLVITTGGTGMGPRDNTPEAMSKLIERQAPGVAEAMRAYGQERNPYAMLSRSSSGIRGKTLIINLPGSKAAVKESLDVIFPSIMHAFKMLAGDGHVDTERETARQE
jgi:molybdenum cofactor biosynthesis protein MoaC